MKKVSLTLSSSLMKFASGHFTIFSATERENIHGHNFTLTMKLDTLLATNDLAFDYQLFKKIAVDFCLGLDEKLLLPLHSPYLAVKQLDQAIQAFFAEEVLTFLPRDVVLLPIANVTVEGLAHYFLDKLLMESALLDQCHIQKIVMVVSSSPAQSAQATWVREA
jgi:6-pyruvoyltetrahydropterin/6-carboxytetrahydropterin synthase